MTQTTNVPCDFKSKSPRSRCVWCGQSRLVSPVRCPVYLEVRLAVADFAYEKWTGWKARLRRAWNEGVKENAYLHQAKTLIGRSHGALDSLTEGVFQEAYRAQREFEAARKTLLEARSSVAREYVMYVHLADGNYTIDTHEFRSEADMVAENAADVLRTHYGSEEDKIEEIEEVWIFAKSAVVPFDVAKVTEQLLDEFEEDVEESDKERDRRTFEELKKKHGW